MPENEDGRRVLFVSKGTGGGEKYFFHFFIFLFIDAHCFAHVATLAGTNAHRRLHRPHSALRTGGAPRAASFKIIYNSTKPKVSLRFRSDGSRSGASSFSQRAAVH